MRSLIAGASYPLRALGLLRRQSSLWRYVVFPVLLNLIIGATIYASLLYAGFHAIDAWVATWPEQLRVLGALLHAILVLALLAATGFVFVRFGVVLGAPFYSRLSERIEQLQLGVAPPPGRAGIVGVLQDFARAIGFEAKKLLLFGVGAVVLLLLGLIPIAGPFIELAGWPTLGATIACLDFFDPPLERHRLGFRRKLGLIRAMMPASAGFGLVCFGLVSIPLVNLLAIPVCVAAGTLCYCDRLVPKLGNQASKAGLR